MAGDEVTKGVWQTVERWTAIRIRSSVSILTGVANGCRISGGEHCANRVNCKPGVIGLLVLACGFFTPVFAAHASQWQSSDEIAEVAEAFAKERFGRSDKRVLPSAGHLDSRLRLPRCSKTLEPFVRPGATFSSRTIIGVRCNGTRPWKVYVPVNVVVMQPVLVARKTFPRGHVMTPADVMFEDHDVGRLSGGYLSSMDELSGQRLKQQIIGGRIITPAMLVAAIVIHRGQSVTLVVRSELMNISMAGKALADGSLNQRIRVENINSQRVVEGLVRSAEYVEILVHK